MGSPLPNYIENKVLDDLIYVNTDPAYLYFGRLPVAFKAFDMARYRL